MQRLTLLWGISPSMTQAFNVFIGWFTRWGMYVCKESALCSLHFVVFETVSFRIVMTELHSCLRGRKVSFRFAQRMGSCREGPAPSAYKRLGSDWAPSKVRAIHTPACPGGWGRMYFCASPFTFRCGVRRQCGLGFFLLTLLPLVYDEVCVDPRPCQEPAERARWEHPAVAYWDRQEECHQKQDAH